MVLGGLEDPPISWDMVALLLQTLVGPLDATLLKILLILAPGDFLLHALMGSCEERGVEEDVG